MDGTLLDLHFDNHFWLHHMPLKIAQKQNISIEQARQYILTEYQKVSGTIDWYCLDFWAEKLNFDIVEAKREVQHLISLRDDTLPFLNALRDAGKEVVLVTNAHPGSLSLKVEHTQLDEHIDTLISTHEFGVTKESQSLWQQLQVRLGFDPETTLFVDDGVAILNSAKTFGIKYLLAVANPDSKLPALTKDQLQGYPFVTDYRDIIGDITD